LKREEDLYGAATDTNIHVKKNHPPGDGMDRHDHRGVRAWLLG
jgi:hypothetical protein